MKIISPQMLICGFAAVQTVFGAEYECDVDLCQEWDCDQWCGCFEENPALEARIPADKCPATNDETCVCGEASSGPPDSTLTLDSTPTLDDSTPEPTAEPTPEPTETPVPTRSHDKQCKIPLTESECRASIHNSELWYSEFGTRKMTFRTSINWKHAYPAGCWYSGTNIYFNKAKYNREMNKRENKFMGSNRLPSERIGVVCMGEERVEIAPEPANVFVNKEGSCKNSLSEEDCISTAFDNYGVFNSVNNWKHAYPAGCWKSGTNFYFNWAKYNRTLNFPSRTATNTLASARINQLCYDDEMDEIITPEPANIFINKEGSCKNSLSIEDCKSHAFDRKGYFNTVTNWKHSYPAGCWSSGRNFYFNKAKYSRALNFPSRTATNTLASARINQLCYNDEMDEIITPKPANVFINKEGSCKNSLSEEDCKSHAFDRKGSFNSVTNWRHSYPAGCWSNGRNFYFNKAKYSRALNYPARTATNTLASEKINQLCYDDEMDEKIVPEISNLYRRESGVCNTPLTQAECISASFDYKGSFNSATKWKHYYPSGCWTSGRNWYYNLSPDSPKQSTSKYATYCRGS